MSASNIRSTRSAKLQTSPKALITSSETGLVPPNETTDDATAGNKGRRCSSRLLRVSESDSNISVQGIKTDQLVESENVEDVLGKIVDKMIDLKDSGQNLPALRPRRSNSALGNRCSNRVDKVIDSKKTDENPPVSRPRRSSSVLGSQTSNRVDKVVELKEPDENPPALRPRRSNSALGNRSSSRLDKIIDSKETDENFPASRPKRTTCILNQTSETKENSGQKEDRRCSGRLSKITSTEENVNPPPPRRSSSRSSMNSETKSIESTRNITTRKYSTRSKNADDVDKSSETMARTGRRSSSRLSQVSSIGSMENLSVADEPVSEETLSEYNEDRGDILSLSVSQVPENKSTTKNRRLSCRINKTSVLEDIKEVPDELIAPRRRSTRVRKESETSNTSEVSASERHRCRRSTVFSTLDKISDEEEVGGKISPLKKDETNREEKLTPRKEEAEDGALNSGDQLHNLIRSEVTRVSSTESLFDTDGKTLKSSNTSECESDGDIFYPSSPKKGSKTDETKPSSVKKHTPDTIEQKRSSLCNVLLQNKKCVVDLVDINSANKRLSKSPGSLAPLHSPGSSKLNNSYNRRISTPLKDCHEVTVLDSNMDRDTTNFDENILKSGNTCKYESDGDVSDPSTPTKGSRTPDESKASSVKKHTVDTKEHKRSSLDDVSLASKTCVVDHIDINSVNEHLSKTAESLTPHLSPLSSKLNNSHHRKISTPSNDCNEAAVLDDDTERNTIINATDLCEVSESNKMIDASLNPEVILNDPDCLLSDVKDNKVVYTPKCSPIKQSPNKSVEKKCTLMNKDNAFDTLNEFAADETDEKRDASCDESKLLSGNKSLEICSSSLRNEPIKENKFKVENMLYANQVDKTNNENEETSLKDSDTDEPELIILNFSDADDDNDHISSDSDLNDSSLGKEKKTFNSITDRIAVDSSIKNDSPVEIQIDVMSQSPNVLKRKSTSLSPKLNQNDSNKINEDFCEIVDSSTDESDKADNGASESAKEISPVPSLDESKENEALINDHSQGPKKSRVSFSDEVVKESNLKSTKKTTLACLNDPEYVSKINGYINNILEGRQKLKKISRFDDFKNSKNSPRKLKKTSTVKPEKGKNENKGASSAGKLVNSTAKTSEMGIEKNIKKLKTNTLVKTKSNETKISNKPEKGKNENKGAGSVKLVNSTAKTSEIGILKNLKQHEAKTPLKSKPNETKMSSKPEKGINENKGAGSVRELLNMTANTSEMSIETILKQGGKKSSALDSNPNLPLNVVEYSSTDPSSCQVQRTSSSNDNTDLKERVGKLLKFVSKPVKGPENVTCASVSELQKVSAETSASLKSKKKSKKMKSQGNTWQQIQTTSPKDAPLKKDYSIYESPTATIKKKNVDRCFEKRDKNCESVVSAESNTTLKQRMKEMKKDVILANWGKISVKNNPQNAGIICKKMYTDLNKWEIKPVSDNNSNKTIEDVIPIPENGGKKKKKKKKKGQPLFGEINSPNTLMKALVSSYMEKSKVSEAAKKSVSEINNSETLCSKKIQKCELSDVAQFTEKKTNQLSFKKARLLDAQDIFYKKTHKGNSQTSSATNDISPAIFAKNEKIINNDLGKKRKFLSETAALTPLSTKKCSSEVTKKFKHADLAPTINNKDMKSLSNDFLEKLKDQPQLNALKSNQENDGEIKRKKKKKKMKGSFQNVGTGGKFINDLQDDFIPLASGSTKFKVAVADKWSIQSSSNTHFKNSHIQRNNLNREPAQNLISYRQKMKKFNKGKTGPAF